MKWLERARAFLGYKNAPLVWGSLAAIFALAAWFRLLLPGVPISDPDTWGYLHPALSDLAGHGFQQTHGRGIAYPLLIKGILQTTSSFFAIPIAQHLLGLLSGAVWWAIWREWLKWLPTDWRNALGMQIVGLVFLALYLWNANAIVSEEMIRPEGVFPLLSLTQTFLCLIYIRFRWIEKSSLSASLAGALAILNGVVCISAKPSWGFAGTVPIILTLLGPLVPLRLSLLPSRILPLVFGLGLVFVWTNLVPKWTGWIPDSSTFLPSTLVTIHAPIISKYLNSEAAKGRLTVAEMAFLENWDRRLEESKKLEKTSYSLLDHDPDYLMYHSDALDILPNANTVAERREFMLCVYASSILHYPHLLILKILKQLQAAFSDLTRALYKRSASLERKLQKSIESMDFYKLPEVGAKMGQSYQEIRSRSGELLETGQLSYNFGPSTSKFLFRGAGPVFLGFLMLAWPAGACFSMRRHRVRNFDLRGAFLVFGVFWATSLGTVLTVAVVHSFDITRYLNLLSAQYSLVLATGLSLLIPWLLDVIRIWFLAKITNPTRSSAL
jgi:hypothetical protein